MAVAVCVCQLDPAALCLTALARSGKMAATGKRRCAAGAWLLLLVGCAFCQWWSPSLRIGGVRLAVLLSLLLIMLAPRLRSRLRPAAQVSAALAPRVLAQGASAGAVAAGPRLRSEDLELGLAAANLPAGSCCEEAPSPRACCESSLSPKPRCSSSPVLVESKALDAWPGLAPAPSISAIELGALARRPPQVRPPVLPTASAFEARALASRALPLSRSALELQVIAGLPPSCPRSSSSTAPSGKGSGEVQWQQRPVDRLRSVSDDLRDDNGDKGCDMASVSSSLPDMFDFMAPESIPINMGAQITLKRITSLPAVSKVSFNLRVSCSYVPDLSGAPAEKKAILWWQPSDFEDFLQRRVDLGKAYRATAKKLGLQIDQVSSVGSHGDEGYRAMIQICPMLKGESRRGLGLGRKKQRALNRLNYLATVLGEQRRQQLQASEEGQPCRLDWEKIGTIARKVSEKDLKYAQKLAQLYYNQDRDAEASAPVPVPPPPPTPPPSAEEPAPASESEGEPTSPAGMQTRSTSFGLNDKEDERQPSRASLTGKGFGLSQEALQKAGLNASGNYFLTRRRQMHQLTFRSDEANSSADGDDEDAEESLELTMSQYVEQYKKWRSGKATHIGMPGQGGRLKTDDDLREEYRAWRMNGMAVQKVL